MSLMPLSAVYNNQIDPFFKKYLNLVIKTVENKIKDNMLASGQTYQHNILYFMLYMHSITMLVMSLN